MNLANVRGHFCTITHHKLIVQKYCFSVGLFRQGLLHDLSKYSPVEFLVGCKYYQGNRSPNNAEREATGVSKAWLHHKGRNKHHFEYWLDYGIDPENKHRISGSYMPVRYVLEMFFDRVAASKNYNREYTDRSPLLYYQRGKLATMPLIHPLSQKLLEKLLVMLADRGEAETMDFIRKKIIPNMRRIDKRNRKVIRSRMQKMNKTIIP